MRFRVPARSEYLGEARWDVLAEGVQARLHALKATGEGDDLTQVLRRCKHTARDETQSVSDAASSRNRYG